MWDAYVATAPGGDLVQTSLWAQVKAVTGWRAARVIVWRDGAIIAGAQLLTRPLTRLGLLACVPRGPLCREEDPQLLGAVIAAVQREALDDNALSLVLQPPRDGMPWARTLLHAGFEPSPIKVTARATTRLDLTQDLEQIWRQLHKSTRRNIRRGGRAGITVREGTAQDLGSVHQLLEASGRAGRFRPLSLPTLQRLWEVLAPHDYVKLFLAEFEGEPVSAQLTIPFGGAVLSKLAGWTGQQGARKPNETLDWAVIQWAKAHGYHSYDLDGVDPQAAPSVLDGSPLPASISQSTTSYKLGFGGQVVLYPPAYDYVPRRWLRIAYRTVLPRVAMLPAMTRLVDRLR